MKKHIPNLITLLNLLCGCIAILFAVNGKLDYAAYFVFAGIFFDFFDGLAARTLNVQSELGLQLDSLADMVTSGVVPGIVMFQLLNKSMDTGYSLLEITTIDALVANAIPLLGFLIILSSGYRLANFNIDAGQKDGFIGLPTPANALLILSFPLLLLYQDNIAIEELILNKWFLLGITLLSTYLLNAKIPLFALKFKTWDFKSNAFRYLFLIASVIGLIVLQFSAIPIIIIGYVVVSMVMNVTSNN